MTAGPEAIPPPADAEFVAPSLDATSVFLEKQPSEAEQHSAAAIYARRYFMGKPIAGKTKEMQSHEKFILSVGYFPLSTPGDCILLGTKVFSPQVPPRPPAGTCRLGLSDRKIPICTR